MNDFGSAPPIVSLVGPTASGKTAVSVELAHLLGGPDAVEIISADAMQLYRGMDIGTAKASHKERRGIAHHQLDVLDLQQEASVAAFQRSARAELEDIQRRNKIPLVVGGSGLYVSALLDELDFPGTDRVIRESLEQVYSEQGLEVLVERLAQLDPETVAIIDTKNPRRVIRALEVVELTGRSYLPRFPRHTSHFEQVFHFGLRCDKVAHDEVIERRARKMFATGLLDETERLLELGLLEAPTAARATGYAQAIAVLRGDMELEEAIEQTAFLTRRLAKKQRTWFGADARIEWFDIDLAAALADDAQMALQVQRVAQAMRERLGAH